MTRRLLLATTAIACLALAACGKEDTTGQTTTEQTTTAQNGESTTTTTTGPATDNSYTPAPQPGDTASTDTATGPDYSSSSSSTSTSSSAANTMAPSTGGETASAMLPTVPDSDLADANSAAGFVQRASMSDQFEIAASRLALTKNVSADIKSYAQMMIDAHNQTSTQIKSLASNHSLTVTAGLSQQQQDWLDALKGATSDAQFASLYTDQQVKAHTAALKLLNDFAAKGDTDDLKQFATATSPKVQEHLTQAEALAKAAPTSNPS